MRLVLSSHAEKNQEKPLGPGYFQIQSALHKLYTSLRFTLDRVDFFHTTGFQNKSMFHTIPRTPDMPLLWLSRIISYRRKKMFMHFLKLELFSVECRRQLNIWSLQMSKHNWLSMWPPPQLSSSVTRRSKYIFSELTPYISSNAN